ncbi:MAG: division/cell wall cluster transcriptional repressor MraZ [Pseudomonadota bacterium]
MDRFLSSAVNRIDAKGRVSVPGAFRALAAKRGYHDLYALRALEEPALDVGGMDLLERYERQLDQTNPFLRTADDMSAYVHGEGTFLKLDADGRITMSDFIREHTGITSEVGFLGRGQFFQIWEPERMRQHLADVRTRLTTLRQAAAQARPSGASE